MTSVFKQKWRVALAAVALGSIGLSGTAFAQNTQSGTSITNTATVNYTVASIAQTPINAQATFVVDTVVDLNVTAVANSTTFTPGQTGVIKAFTVNNTSNATSNYTLAAVNLTTDDFQMFSPGTTTVGIDVRVDGNGNGTYEAGSDTATSITGLARGATVTVFVVGDVPNTATNGQEADIQLTASGVNPADSNPWTSTAGADTAAGVEIVVRNLADNDTNTYVIASAALSVSKSSVVISDPVNLVSPNAKAIPGAVVEYVITVSNAAGAQTATLTGINDPIPANTTFQAASYAGSTNVSITAGGGPAAFCTAEAGGVDSNADGCVINGGALVVASPAISTVAANSSVVVRFRVTID